MANRGAAIVRELMIYAGQDQVSLVEPVDVSRLVEEMLELLKVSVSKQVELKIELGKKLPAVWGSAAQIRQVVMNLVINASEAIGSKEGVIRVSTSLVTRSRARLVTMPRLDPAAITCVWKCRTPAWDDRGGKREDLRSVLHHEIRRPWPGTGRCSRDRASPRRRDRSGECSWPRRDVSGVTAVHFR